MDRSEREPRNSSNPSPQVRIVLLQQRKREAYIDGGAVLAGSDVKVSAKSFNPFAHSGNADSHNLFARIDPGDNLGCYANALVAHLNGDLLGVCSHSDFGYVSSRVSMDI